MGGGGSTPSYGPCKYGCAAPKGMLLLAVGGQKLQGINYTVPFFHSSLFFRSGYLSLTIA